MDKTEKQNDYISMFCVLLAALCFSIGGLCIKVLPWSVLAINGARNLIGAAVIGIYILATHHKIRVNKPVIVGAICIIGVTTFFILANKLTTAASAIVLQYTAPVFVILFMTFIFHEKPKKQDITTCIAVFAGVCIFFVEGLSKGSLTGDLMAIVSAIFYSGVLMMNTSEDADPLSSSFIGQLTAGIIFTPFCFQETDFSAPVLGTIFVLGAVQVGLAYVFLSAGIRRTKPVTASFILSLEPILNPVWVALFYGEKITPLAFLGAVIVVGAVLRYNVITQSQEETK